MRESLLSRRADVLLAAGVMLVLGVMIVPVAPQILDFFLIANLTLALMILTLTIYAPRPLDFNTFPTVLLLATLFRLALNVATTRQILLNGYGGKVIGAFGNFVVGGNYAVGAVAFIILIVIQFLVITKGAQRIAEVTARFTLDAMPGKQMAIDADLNAGLIDEQQARQRRAEISQQADFYGAMDGAAKFVRGDAVAGIIITAINIIGGLVVGVAQLKMSLGEAGRTFTLLTIGDGLVAQIPALVIATASGILITRTEAQRHLGAELVGQLLGEARAPTVAAGILLLLGLVPGLPLVPFWLLAGLAGAAGLFSRREKQRAAAAAAAKAQTPKTDAPERVEQLLELDELELEIGFGLIPLVDEEAGGELLQRVTLMRRQLAADLGFIVPPVRIRDNVRLPAESYVIKMRGEEIGRGELVVGQLSAMGPSAQHAQIPGVRMREPVFGLPAIWIMNDQRSEAEAAGLTVVEPAAVVATHLTELVRGHAHELLTRQDVKQLLDQVKETHPALVEELVPHLLTLSGVQQVLKRMLREQVSIRDMVTILETLADTVPQVKDLDVLVERTRAALGRSLLRPYRNAQGEVNVVTLDPKLEQQLVDAVVPGQEGNARLVLDPSQTQVLMESLSDAVQKALAVAQHPILLCSQYLRPYLRDFVTRFIPQAVVLSYPEVTGVATVQTVATVRGASRAA